MTYFGVISKIFQIGHPLRPFLRPRDEHVVPRLGVAGLGVVDVERLYLGVLVEPVRAELAADAGLLVTAELRALRQHVPLVDPDCAGA